MQRSIAGSSCPLLRPHPVSALGLGKIVRPSVMPAPAPCPSSWTGRRLCTRPLAHVPAISLTPIHSKTPSPPPIASHASPRTLYRSQIHFPIDRQSLV